MYRRQSDPLAVPTTISGISGTTRTVVTQVDTSTLIFDSSFTGAQDTAPSLAPTKPVTLTTSLPSSDPTPPPETSSSSKTASAAGADPIPISTVIAACVSAFVGAAVVILLGWWLYKRSSRNLKNRSRRRNWAPLANNRNVRGEYDRSKSRSENWAKLEDADAKWEGEYQMKELDPPGSMEKLNMFRKAASLRSFGKESTTDQPLVFENHPFSRYHRNVVEELPEVPKSQSPAHLDSGAPTPWADKFSGTNDPFLAIKSSRLTTSAVSSSRNIAIPTPQAVSIEPHHWESAQVMDYDEELASSASSPRKSSGERERDGRRKGKERAHDPFGDQYRVPKPNLPALHVATPSSSSTYSNERALQSLIAALDITPEQIQERLRVAEMFPSTPSPRSFVNDGDVTSKFPLPPR